jgi:signal peptidase I
VGLLPSDEGNHLIKRVVGLPGDTVSCCSTDGRLRVNGVPITEPYLFPGDVPSEIEFAVTVPAGKIWVMGDHRSDSSDSRYNDVLGTEAGADPKDNTGVYGSVPIDNVVGSAFSIVWPLNRATWLGNPSDTFAAVPAAGTPAPTPSASVKSSAKATASAAPPATRAG